MFLNAGTLKCARLGSGVSCEAPAALQTPPKFHERTPREEERKKIVAGEEKKRKKLGPPTLRGPLSRLGPPPFGGLTLWGPPPFEGLHFCMNCLPSTEERKIGPSRKNLGEIFLAEVELA